MYDRHPLLPIDIQFGVYTPHLSMATTYVQKFERDKNGHTIKHKMSIKKGTNATKEIMIGIIVSHNSA